MTLRHKLLTLVHEDISPELREAIERELAMLAKKVETVPASVWIERPSVGYTADEFVRVPRWKE